MEELLEKENTTKNEDISTNNKCKILLVTHKPCKIPKSEFIVPIHAGREVALEKSKDGSINQQDLDWLIENTIGDNTGDNISAKNRYYSECSALYWAWKNYDELGNPDYIGLMHYRRHFIFDDEYYKTKWPIGTNFDKSMSTIRENFIDEYTINKIGLNDINIKQIINNNDIIVSYPSQFNILYPIEYASIRMDYFKNIPQVKIKDFDLMISIIKKKYPDYSADIDNYINGQRKYMFQMFIMKKDLFFKYCEFLFDILFEIEQMVDFNSYEINGKRSLGYLAEIMLTIFLIIQSKKQLLKIKECGIAIFNYTEPYDKLLEKANRTNFYYLNYLKYKIRYLLTINTKEKERLKVKYKNYKQQYKLTIEFKKVQNK